MPTPWRYSPGTGAPGKTIGVPARAGAATGLGSRESVARALRAATRRGDSGGASTGAFAQQAATPPYGPPITLDDAPLQIDPDHLRRPEFGPGDQPWVAQQRAVAEVHRDVTRQVVAVALAPQRASKYYKLFPRGQVGYELFSRWREQMTSHLLSAIPVRAGSSQAKGGGREPRHSSSTWRAARRPECGPSIPRSHVAYRAMSRRRGGNRPRP